jgi:hypothetical protein
MNELTKNEQEPTLCAVETAELQAIEGGYDPDNWCGTKPPGWHPPLPKPPVCPPKGILL